MLNASPPSDTNSIPWDIVRCPTCFGPVVQHEKTISCTTPRCQKIYPVVTGIPVMINENSSVFTLDDFSENKTTFFKKRSSILEWLNKNGPTISHNLAAKDNYKQLSALALEGKSTARVLVIGGSIAGQGFEVLSDNSALELVETDVSFGPRVKMICDGHDLPFADSSFDAVITQAVLEHVVDPIRCVSEIRRVLKNDGLIYAETPFMQQVHGGSYDFTRFTFRGHRRLFRHFEEVQAGMIGGPGMALAWSWQYFLRSFARTTRMHMLLTIIGRLTSFYLKYFDHLLKDKPASYDAASGFYFMGRRSAEILNDKVLVNVYPAAHSHSEQPVR